MPIDILVVGEKVGLPALGALEFPLVRRHGRRRYPWRIPSRATDLLVGEQVPLTSRRSAPVL